MRPVIAIALCLSLFWACKEGDKSSPSPDVRMTATPKTDSLPSDTVMADSTSKALSYEQLRTYLPKGNADFKMEGESSGENSFRGQSGTRYYAFARQAYRTTGTTGTIMMEIIDYAADPATFNGLLNMYGFNEGINNNTLQTSPVDMNIPGVKALVSNFKTEKRAHLIIAIGGRFMVQVLGEGVNNVTVLKKLATDSNLRLLLEKSANTAA